MALIVGSAGQLKPEARLGQAVVQFEASLTKEQKASFEAGRIHAQSSPPSVSDVMQLTAEIDFQTHKAGRRCFGLRMTKILESVQQFASIGDVIVGGSQNLIACGVWSLVRVTLLVRRPSIYLCSGIDSTHIDCRAILRIPRGPLIPVDGSRIISSSLSRNGSATP